MATDLEHLDMILNAPREISVSYTMSVLASKAINGIQEEFAKPKPEPEEKSPEIKAAEEYQDLRIAEYPTIKDQLDDLYEVALEIVKSERKASTSFLQRKLQIGYNRAARIIDMMEADGIVSKANHVGKRDVL